MNLTDERIVITGGHGFLGRYLFAELQKRGASLFRFHRAVYDLIDRKAVARMFRDFNPTVVIHLAAEVGGIGANLKTPGRFFYANMLMGINLIEGARLSKLKKFVQIGTVCAYPKHCPTPFKESDLWNGYPEETNAPYGVAKKALLVMLQAYRQQYGLNGIYLLPVNLYGPGDNFDPKTSHVIPALIRKFCEGDSMVWGTGEASREFVHVRDAARAIVLATERYDKPEPVNIGTGHSVTIRQLVDQIKELTGLEDEVVWDGSKPDGQPMRQLDTQRAQEEFGFQAQIPLENGLKETIAWWREQ